MIKDTIHSVLFSGHYQILRYTAALEGNQNKKRLVSMANQIVLFMVDRKIATIAITLVKWTRYRMLPIINITELRSLTEHISTL